MNFLDLNARLTKKPFVGSKLWLERQHGCDVGSVGNARKM